MMLGLGAGFVLAGLLVLWFPPGRPSPQEIERQARALGMVYRQEVLVLSSPPAPAAPEQATGGPPEEGRARETRTVVIPPGSNLHQVAQILAREGLVPDPEAFEALGIAQNASRRLQAGRFTITLPAGPAELLEQLTGPPEN